MTRNRIAVMLAVFATAGSALFAGSRWAPAASSAQAAQRTAEAWAQTQTVEPAALVKELAGAAATRPTVVCVGIPALYRAGHVPGASLHGPVSSPAALADLQRWAQSLPRSTNVVLYCGCCPFDQCPNVRPAFTALRDMGFTHLRVLMLPNNFAADWAGKGYPVQR